MTGRRPLVPPQRLAADGLVVRRLTVADAAAVADAVTASLDHLRPWMPWATEEAATVAAQRARLAGPAGRWTRTSDYSYGMFTPTGLLVGAAGLMRRPGPGALEIGYWAHVDHGGQGYVTAAAGVLTVAGLAVAGVDRVEIHCDVANRRSAAIPARLGYRLAGVVDHAPEAPAETGRREVWVVEPGWTGPPA